MRELIELRVNAEHASLAFSPNEGIDLGGIRKIEVDVSESRIATIARVQRRLREEGKAPLFFGWKINRLYTAQELGEAELFCLNVTAVFAPSGDEYGTIYDETLGCPHVFAEIDLEVPRGEPIHVVHTCGVGAHQVSDLVLDFRKLPKHVDICSSFANETVLSERLVDVLVNGDVSGLTLRPVEDWNAALGKTLRKPTKKSRHFKTWKQLVITS